MSPVLVIRPEPGCSATVDAARSKDLPAEACPLFEIGPLAWQPPPPDEVDALLLGSANAVRHGGPHLAGFRDKPVYAVGEITAAAAVAAGFAVVAAGRGGMQQMLEAAAGKPQRLLRLAGAEHVPITPPAGIEIATRVVYQAAPLPMPEAVARRLGEGALVLLHSAAAAGHFARECDRLGIPRGKIALAAFGPRIAAAAGADWAAVRATAAPREAALLALARDMCHEPPTG